MALAIDSRTTPFCQNPSIPFHDWYEKSPWLQVYRWWDSGSQKRNIAKLKLFFSFSTWIGSGNQFLCKAYWALKKKRKRHNFSHGTFFDTCMPKTHQSCWKTFQGCICLRAHSRLVPSSCLSTCQLLNQSHHSLSWGCCCWCDWSGWLNTGGRTGKTLIESKTMKIVWHPFWLPVSEIFKTQKISCFYVSTVSILNWKPFSNYLIVVLW